ncbi:MAG: AAA family ATPase [Alphaproteobacteria bacterium]|nr:AAA family ATPase [Alphaproteobacteria bacterium]
MRDAVARHFLLRVRLERDRVPSFETYPFNLPAVRTLTELELHPAVTYFVGENGSGKSTLLEAIAVAAGFNPEGGSRNLAFATRASHSVLHEYIRLVRGLVRPRDGYFLRAESFFNVATKIEHLDQGPGGPPIVNSYGGRSLHEQSHGEAFFALLTKRFGGRGLYVLDEPEAALSATRQLAFLSRLQELVRDGSQFLIATHAPIIMAYPNATIQVVSDDGLTPTPFEETEHVRIAGSFLRNRERMLRELMKP